MIKSWPNTTNDKPHHDWAPEKGATDVQAKFAELAHMAAAEFNGGASVIDFTKKFDPSNLSGSVRPALDIMKKLMNNTDPMQALQGMLGGGMYGTLLGIIGQFQGAKNSSQNQNQGPNPGEPCTLYDTLGNTYPGVLQYTNTGILTCQSNTVVSTPPGPLSQINPLVS
jgi:hypothetical protein